MTAALRSPLHRGRLGVALIEALIALVVMAFGMLALVGVQATLRMNSDIARQRSEATRIATQEMEQLRSFISVQPVAGQPGVSWDEIASRPSPLAVQGTNATYSLARAVTSQGTNQKSVHVVVSWTDRTNAPQSVTFDSVLLAASPPMSALLRVPTQISAIAQSAGRNPTIPPQAVDLGDGRSLFIPPTSVNTYWYFNNITGELRVCNAQGSSAGCPVASLVAGFVDFDLQSPPNASSPQGPAMNLANGPGALSLSGPVGAGTAASCFAASYTPAQLAARTWIAYTCAVYTQDVTGWGGSLLVNLVDANGLALTPAAVAGSPKICRYTKSAGQYAPNTDHPRTYCMISPATAASCPSSRVSGNLINQNFLVMDGAQVCPASTQPHQPFP